MCCFGQHRGHAAKAQKLWETETNTRSHAWGLGIPTYQAKSGRTPWLDILTNQANEMWWKTILVFLLQRHWLILLQCIPHCHPLCSQKHWIGMAGGMCSKSLVCPMSQIDPNTAQALLIHAATWQAYSIQAICFHSCKQAQHVIQPRLQFLGTHCLMKKNLWHCPFWKVLPNK